MSLTLSDLRRILYEDPCEMPLPVLAWAIDTLEHRLTLIPEDTPAHERYALRLTVLKSDRQRRA